MCRLLLYTAVFAALCVGAPGAPETGKPTKSKSKLTRSDGKRWERLSEIIKVELKSATRKFLEDRDQALIIPLEVDILMLGFDEDGGFHYSLEPRELEEALTSMHSQRDICPTVWTTREPSAVCFNVNYVMLSPPENGIQTVERVLNSAMRLKGNRTYDYLGDGHWGAQHPEQVYEVVADGAVEDKLYEVLVQAYQEDNVALPYGLKDSQELASHRLAVIVLNPHKMRMSPMLDWQGQQAHEEWHRGIVELWKEGHVNHEELVKHEGGYSYRYSYLGRGASASWVSRHNFVVVDVSAGPVTFGPQTSPAGEIEPPAMPRILPILLRMAAELERTDQMSTIWTHLINQAEEGCHMLLVGQLAALVASATRHLFCPDLRFERVEHARNILIPVIALYDAELSDPTSVYPPPYRQIDLPRVQQSLNQLLDSGQEGFIETRSKPLSEFPGILAALHKARVSRSDVVILKEPDVGLHKVHRESVDPDVLLAELLMAVPELSDGTLDVVDDEDRWMSEWQGLADHARHEGTRVLPIFVLTLTCAPDQMMFSNRQLVAANHDAVVVLQLVKPENDSPSSEDGTVMSGHVVDGQNLAIDAAGGVTTNIVAGLAMALTGLVPSYERHDAWEDKVVQDWRWSVGSLPWLPHSHSTQLSGVLIASAKRNFFISHIELVVRAVQKRLTKLDALVSSRLVDPFAYLFDPELEFNKREHLHGNEETQAHAQKLLDPKSHLNLLISMSLKSGYNESFPATTREQLEKDLESVQEKLQQLSWDLWAGSWDHAHDNLIELMAATDLFIKHADKDLEAAEDAAACCSLHHSTAIRTQTLIVLLSVVFLIALVLIVVAMFAGAHPSHGRGGGGYGAADGLGGLGFPASRRRSASLSGGGLGFGPPAPRSGTSGPGTPPGQLSPFERDASASGAAAAALSPGAYDAMYGGGMYGSSPSLARAGSGGTPVQVHRISSSGMVGGSGGAAMQVPRMSSSGSMGQSLTRQLSNTLRAVTGRGSGSRDALPMYQRDKKGDKDGKYQV